MTYIAYVKNSNYIYNTKNNPNERNKLQTKKNKRKLKRT